MLWPPTGTFEMLKSPWVLVRALTSVRHTNTLAFGMPIPRSSITLPEIVPVSMLGISSSFSGRTRPTYDMNVYFSKWV